MPDILATQKTPAIKPESGRIYTSFEIEQLAQNLRDCTYIKRQNLRRRFTSHTNREIDRQIAEKRKVLRSMVSQREQAKRSLYAEITRLEIRKL